MYKLINNIENHRLELITDDKNHNPIYVDFIEGKLNHRRKYGGGKSQAIAKACGIKDKFRPSIIDATAGLGEDAFVLACLGCKVLMLERNEILFKLLNDGLLRATKHIKTIGENENNKGKIELKDIKELENIFENNLKLINIDSNLYLMSLINETKDNQPDVIYLDPMFPKREKSALVKKEMRALHEIVGSDDSNNLLTTALKVATKRVVVKRPANSEILGGNNFNVKPSFSYKGKANRFDIYLCQR